MENNEYKNYLEDLITIQLDKLNSLKLEIASSDENDKDYIKGQIMAYYDTLTNMISQAELFNIQLDKLENIDLEKYLYLK